jgi:hypothetical protein
MAILASLKTDKSPLKARYGQLAVTLNAVLKARTVKARTAWQDPNQSEDNYGCWAWPFFK